MADYGYITTASSVANELRNLNKDYYGNKIWDSAYANLAISAEQSLGSLQEDYAQAMTEAYSSAFNTKSNIASSNIGQGFKELNIANTQAELEAAFDSYRQNYLSNASTISSNLQENVASIAEQQNTQAENANELLNAPYDYLTYMYENYGDTDLFTNPTWSRYLTTDAEGNTTLKSKEQIMNVGAEGGLYDQYGNLTAEGKDFYDQMLNQIAYEGVTDETGDSAYTSFGNWLSENNSDLFDWATSSAYGYNEAGTNLGLFKNLVGLSSTDEQYRFIENTTGMSSATIDKMFGTYDKKIEKLISDYNIEGTYKGSTTNTKKYISDMSNLLDGMTDNLEDLGVSTDTISELNASIENIKTQMNEVKSTLGWNRFWKDLATTGLGALAGGIVGNIPGAILGGVVALAANSISQQNKRESSKSELVDYSNQLKEQYTKFLASVIAYDQSKK